jgi:AraC family transcriptional regulator of adaptative response/methylated-DNA-[protein]-cysteine methyltransferase
MTATMRARADAYATVEKAIRYLRTHATSQPTLADVARHVGQSEFHLQRVFSAWAGISPKRFLQALSVEHARAALADNRVDVLSAALNAGFSGPGRLHDAMVAVEAMTPGEVKRGGADIDIVWGTAQSPFGPLVVGRTTRGVCHVELGVRAVAGLKRAWPHANLVRDDETARGLVEDMFPPMRGRSRPLPVLLKGTNFQVQVWRALLRVPEGRLVSYGQLAHMIGQPSAARAVGSAVAKNAVALLIPCHRVIREDGMIGNYRWGEDRKRAVIAWEGRATL